VLNFLILAVLSLFTARKGESPSWIQRILSVVLAVFTLVLISTAVAKMVMYIDCYGLTPKRVYATWLMLVLAVLFLLIIIRQFTERMKLIPVGMAACVVLYAALGLSGTDAFIAKYNVDRYLDGSLKEVDVSAMAQLGDAAVPQLVRLVQIMDEENGTDIAAYIYGEDDDMPDKTLYEEVADTLYGAAYEWDEGLFSFTIPHVRAQAALKEAGILPLSEETQ
jgi:hypothetical protein